MIMVRDTRRDQGKLAFQGNKCNIDVSRTTVSKARKVRTFWAFVFGGEACGF